MHRKCFNGHSRGTMRAQGRHWSVSSPSVIERGASGPNPNAGTVGPKIATVGVPTADAICSGAESFDTMTAQRRISSADPSGESRPVASTAFGTNARISFANGTSAALPTTTMRAELASSRASQG